MWESVGTNPAVTLPAGTGESATHCRESTGVHVEEETLGHTAGTGDNTGDTEELQGDKVNTVCNKYEAVIVKR